MENNMTFGKRLEHTIKVRGKSKIGIATKLGYDTSTVYKWCNDESEPRLSGIISLCKELKCSADWLVFGKQ